jgi:hypothetical protein
MTGVYLTRNDRRITGSSRPTSSPHPPPLKADALPLSGQYSSHNRLSLWPLHRRLQDGKEGIGGEQDKLILLTASRTVRLAVSAAPTPFPQAACFPPLIAYLSGRCIAVR